MLPYYYNCVYYMPEGRIMGGTYRALRTVLSVAMVSIKAKSVSKIEVRRNDQLYLTLRKKGS